MLLLDVPYNEKDEAKALGARWDPELKKWYVQNERNYYKFTKWIFKEGCSVACKNLYIVEAKRKCYKCGYETTVVSLAADDYWTFDGLEDVLEGRTTVDVSNGFGPEEADDCCHYADFFVLLGLTENIPTALLNYMLDKYNIRNKFSNTTKKKSLSNLCERCNALHGNWYLFQEVDSPFWIYDRQDIKKLKFYRIPLKYDLILSSGEVTDMGVSAFWIKRYADMEPLNLDIYK